MAEQPPSVGSSPAPAEPVGPRVVVLDDNTELVAAISRSLAREGFRVHPFDDPLRALEFLRSSHVDFLILDYDLPWVNGRKIIEFLKFHESSTRVIMISAFDHFQREPWFRETTAIRAFLRKPFEMADLVTALRDI